MTGYQPMAASLKHDYPEVEQAVRFRSYGGFLVKKGNENLREERVIYADSTLFSVFTLPLLSGNPATALTGPNNVVITESTARKYFNSTQVLGRFLTIWPRASGAAGCGAVSSYSSSPSLLC